MRWTMWGVLACMLACGGGTEQSSEIPDGAACEVDDECDSKDCKGGYCAGKSCENAPGRCESGWFCDTCESVLGCTDYCRQHCGNCPEGYLCGDESYCVYAPQLVVDAGGPYVTVHGMATQLSATVSPADADIVEWLWSGDQINGTLPGPTATHTFSLGGPWRINAIVREADGVVAAGQTQVTVCLDRGMTCEDNFPEFCCEGYRCLGTAGSRTCMP